MALVATDAERAGLCALAQTTEVVVMRKDLPPGIDMERLLGLALASDMAQVWLGVEGDGEWWKIDVKNDETAAARDRLMASGAEYTLPGLLAAIHAEGGRAAEGAVPMSREDYIEMFGSSDT
jgi:hypothetical protein